MSRYLLDENLSPRIARHLQQAHGLDAISILQLGYGGIDDAGVRDLARELRRVIITLDRDFIDPLACKFQTPPGIIWLNPPRSLRTVPGQIRLLDRFFEREAGELQLDDLIIEVDAFTSIVLHSAN